MSFLIVLVPLYGLKHVFYGLKIHLGKTKLLTNIAKQNRPEKIQVGAEWIQVLQEEEGERYLGRKLCLDNYQGMELANRIAAGWASFMKNKVALCNRDCCLKSRLKVFDSIVTPTVLYGASSWAMKTDMEHLLCTTRRRMLRYIVGVRRKQDESWVEYVQRSTHKSEDLSKKCHLNTWNDLQRFVAAHGKINSRP